MLPRFPAHVVVSGTALTLLSTWGGVLGAGQGQVVRQGLWAGSELGPRAGSVLGAPVLRGSTGVIHFKGLALKAGFPLTAVRREGGESRCERDKNWLFKEQNQTGAYVLVLNLASQSPLVLL